MAKVDGALTAGDVVVERTAQEERHYTRGKLLGKGGFAAVYEFTCVETCEKYAGKVVAKASLVNHKTREKLLSEISIHKSLKHPNIVQVERFFEDKENVYILMELCHNHSLCELLKRRKVLTELEIQSYLLQIISGLKFIHSRHILHRDVKIGNLFLNEDLRVKIGDFGLAARLNGPADSRKTVCGTPNYIAPEVLAGKRGYNHQADVWSLGVVIYTLATGKPPFETNDVNKTYKLVKLNAYSFPSHLGLSEQLKGLITRILKTDPTKRPSLDEILQHEFFHMGYSIPKLMPLSTLTTPPVLLQGKPCLRKKTGTLPVKLTTEESESTLESAQKPLELVRVMEWLDYSSKYGLGYLLSNGVVGVCYNDDTKIVSGKGSAVLFYIEKSKDGAEMASMYSFTCHPRELSQKTAIFNKFKEILGKQDYSGPRGISLEVPVFIRKWVKVKKAVVFHFSTRIIQVIFKDRTEVVVSSESKYITYVNEGHAKERLLLSAALSTRNSILKKRLKYTKEILHSICNPKSSF